MHPVLRIAAALVLGLSLGLHWAVLQTVAWTGMFITYSRGASFAEAVEKTFDGQHPCKLCCAVRAGKAAEKKQAQVKPEHKLEIGLPWQAIEFVFASVREPIVSFDRKNLSRREPPPIPPPRVA